MNAAEIWWNARAHMVGKPMVSPAGETKKTELVCPDCERSDELSLFISKAPNGNTLYLLGCDRCCEEIRYVPKRAALEVERHYHG